MKQVKQDSLYNVYQITLDNYISINSGVNQVYFLVIQNNLICSKFLGNISLKYDNFSTANKLFLMEALTTEVKTICAKIEEYTKLNIQLYKDMREVKGLND